MKRLIFITLLLISINVFSQQQISEVRNAAIGTEVTVKGVALNGEELGAIRYIDDGTAGIGVYNNNDFNKINEIKPGDLVTVTGKISEYNNLLEITDVTNVIIHSSNNNLPSPIELNINDISESYEGRLVKISDVTIESGSSFAGSTNYSITDNSNSIDIRINNNASTIIGQPVPSGKFELIAIVSQYKESYQLLPRKFDDFTFTGSVNIISSVKATDITKNSLSIEWFSDVSAKAAIKYSNADDLLLTNEAEGTNEKVGDRYKNSVTFQNLEAGAIFLVEAMSIVGSDTATSMQKFGTVSNSTGQMTVYFNTEVDKTYATITEAQNIDDAMEDTLMAYIDRATESVDLCLYNFNNNGLSNMSEAINNAYRRGVKVRFITSGTTAHSGMYDLDSAIPTLESPPKSNSSIGLMHNKFVIIDAEASNPNKSYVWTGSTNLTREQVNSDANNMIFIQDQTLAKAYQIEFEEMWGSDNMAPNAQNARFGNKKKNNTPHQFVIGGTKVESYFSPSDETNQQIIKTIGTADYNLNIATMLITRTDLANAIKDAVDKDVKVNIMTNSDQSQYDDVNSILSDLIAKKHFVQDLSSVPGALHHKYAIIDVDKNSDPTVITGSHNWSISADTKNDENTLFIYSDDIANQYFQNYVARFTANNGVMTSIDDLLIDKTITVYPNPVSESVTISTHKNIELIELYSLNGTKMRTLNNINSTQKRIQLAKLTPGTYLVLVKTNDNNIHFSKLIKR